MKTLNTRKTTSELLYELPEDERLKFIDNLINRSDANEKLINLYLYQPAIDDSLSRCVNSAFIWSKTLEGKEYWQNIYHREYDKETEKEKEKLKTRRDVKNRT